MGVGGNGLRQIVSQFKQIRVFADTLLPLLRSHAEDIGDKVQILAAGHVVVQIRVVGDIGQLPFACQGICLYRCAIDGDLSLLKGQDPHHSLQGGGFACAVMTDEAVNLAGGDVQTQIIHRFLFAVTLGQMLNIKHVMSS